MSRKYLYIALLCLTAMVIACTSDLDFEQANDVEIRPIVDLDLIFFKATTENFVDTDTGEQRTEVLDTVKLEFLEEQFFQENILQFDYDLLWENTFSQGFEGKVEFIDRNDNIRYTESFEIPGSPDGTVEVLRVTETLTPEELNEVKASLFFVVSATINTNDDPIEGELIFQSKAVYYLRF